MTAKIANARASKSSNSAYVNSDQYPLDRDAVISALQELGISNNKLANLAGVSAASLSQATSGKYPSCPSTILGAALKAVDQIRGSRSYNGSLPLVETSIMRLVKSVCDEAYQLRETDCIGLATGKVGVGKTTALKRYAKDNNFAIYLRADIGMSKSSMLIDLTDALGISDYKATTISAKQTSIKKYLRAHPKLIIFDEGNRASKQVLEALRDICDSAESGLVYAGREFLYERLASNTGDLGEIASRILSWHKPIQCLTKDDVYLIINKSVHTRELDDDIKVMLFECSEQNGRVMQHLMQKLYKWKVNMQDQEKDDTITAKLISDVYNAVIVPNSAAWQRN